MVVSKAIWKYTSFGKPKLCAKIILPPIPKGIAVITAIGIRKLSYRAAKHRKINAMEIKYNQMA